MSSRRDSYRSKRSMQSRSATADEKEPDKEGKIYSPIIRWFYRRSQKHIISWAVALVFVIFIIYELEDKKLLFSRRTMLDFKSARGIEAANLLKSFKDFDCSLKNPWKNKYSNTNLLIVYKHPNYETAPYLYYLYKRFFRTVTFCADSINADKSWRKTVLDTNIPLFTYRTSFRDKDPGHMSSLCLIKPHIESKTGGDGYLVIDEATVLNLWNLDELPLLKSNVWSLQSTAKYNPEGNTVRVLASEDAALVKAWSLWEETRRPLLKLHEKLTDSAGSDRKVVHCVKKLTSTEGTVYYHGNPISDVIYYIPTRLLADFVYLLNVFSYYDLPSILVVPTILHCVADPTRIQYIPSRGVNKDFKYNMNADLASLNWKQYWLDYDETTAIFYPLKLSPITYGVTDALQSFKNLNQTCFTPLLQ